jgi:hypothetical protein
LELLNKVAFSGARIEEFLAFVRFSGLDTTLISVTDQNGAQIGFASVEPITVCCLIIYMLLSYFCFT